MAASSGGAVRRPDSACIGEEAKGGRGDFAARELTKSARATTMEVSSEKKESTLAKIGFMGLGIMGLPMSANLAKKCGQPVISYDLAPERRALHEKGGGETAPDADALFAGADVVFLCLPTTEAMRDCVERILAKGKPGTVIIDLGSSAPGVVRELYPIVKAKGMHLIDSPVSGGEAGAKAGTLVIMSGGDSEVFERIKPLLLCMGTRATYMGATGNGSVAKLANNMMVAVHMGVMGEAYAFAVKAGLDPATLFEAIKDGLAASAVMTLKIPKIISRDFSPAARMAVMHKDIRNAAKLAGEMAVEIPLTQNVLDGLDELEAMGKGGEDHMNIVRIYERDMGVEVK